ncbi:MAG: presenilin family intramembrane aspartyl protease [Nanoarchaeota archaeon]|nr:presenilin family intramembrane aspartyl protease [Nanoarchaeota archaeon]
MKHNKRITIIILAMFLLTQFIGLGIVNHYSQEKNVLPYGMDNSELQDQTASSNLFSIVFAFIIAIFLVFLLMKVKAKFILRAWFFLVTVLALGISFTSFLPGIKQASLIAAVIALPIALYKIYGKGFIVHNLSELLIYPGIAAVFVSLLNLIGIIILLVIISLYDAWAVWKSKIMQKMAKFQMDELKIFSGFYLPYASKKQRAKIKRLRKAKKDLSKSKIKVNVAILGGGDIIFPIITSGIVFKVWGLWSAIFVIFGALFGLTYLLIFSEKKKAYPAMPFITTGMFLMMLISWLIFVL